MWKKCDIKLVSTDKKAEFFIVNHLRGFKDKLVLNGIFHHLYILSDDKIKKSDWYWSKLHNALFQAISDEQYFENEFKVITTTDKSLLLPIPEELAEYPHSYTQKPIPQLSQSFIGHFITEYNKGNIITEVEVEYTQDGW
jgi:hypothetical protein